MKQQKNGVPVLIQRLIMLRLSLKKGDPRLQKFLNYFLRIVSSRLEPNKGVMQSEEQLRILYQKRISDI